MTETGDKLREIATFYDTAITELGKLKAKHEAQSKAMSLLRQENDALLKRIDAIEATDVERLRREHTEMIERLHRVKKSLTGEGG